MPPSSAKAAALHARAAGLEAEGDIAGAVDAYQAALALAPQDGDILADLADLAGRMGMPDTAAALWRNLLAAEPQRLEAIDGLARALRDRHRYDEAIAVLQPVLQKHVGEARLWNTLGTVLNQKGDSDLALTFFEEAVRLEPRLAVALNNRGGVKFDLGRLDEAEADLHAARDAADRPEHTAAIDFALATLKLCQGELGAGWDLFEARLSPHFPKAPVFDAPGRRWTPEADIAGKRLLVIGEQGLGDEVMFATVLPDLIEALGPQGRLSLAIEPRLQSLFARSYPAAEVTGHTTEMQGWRPHRSAPGVRDPGSVDLWTPLASLTRRFRRTLADFPAAPQRLRPDPKRVEHWRCQLGEGPPAVGISWRSGNLTGERRREFPTLEDLRPLLAVSSVRFVNLQYDALAEELQALGEIAGRPLLDPPGIDLRNDLDDLAALACALDLLVTVPNATAQLAAAAGATVAFLGGPVSWPKLGTEAYPWHPNARSFAAEAYGRWDGPTGAVAEMVSGLSAAAK